VKSGQILFLVLPVAFVLILFNAQRKRGRQATALQEQLTVGATICMTSGLFGTVVSMTEAEVILEAAPGVNLRFDRRAVGFVVPSEQPVASEPAPDVPNPTDEDPPPPAVT
jgi:preprotein translocase subunit YajC